MNETQKKWLIFGVIILVVLFLFVYMSNDDPSLSAKKSEVSDNDPQDPSDCSPKCAEDHDCIDGDCLYNPETR